MQDVLISGAGPTGLILALSLARRGIAVRIVDRKPGPSDESRAIAVQARTLELYAQLGLADALVAAGAHVEHIHLRERGGERARFGIGDIGRGLSPFPFVLCYPQDEHERFLVAELGKLGVAVEWRTTLTHLEQRDDAVEVTLEHEGGSSRSLYPYVCGCDGGRSMVRKSLRIDFEGGDYARRFYVADVRIRDLPARDIYANVSGGGLVLVMPVRQDQQRLIGMVPDALSDREDLRFEDVRAGAEALIGLRVDELHWFSSYRVHHRVAARFRAGRCFLLGDAGHLHSPVGGQGMNTGIGDAINLGWKLAQVIAGRASPSLLDSYDPERIAFARSLVATTDAVFQRIIGRSVFAELLRAFIAPHLVGFFTGFPTARRWLFDLVSQIRIQYRDSMLSEGQAGPIRGGDRLPWVREPDNFAALTSCDWQLHVYGEPAEDLRAIASSLALPLCARPFSRDAEVAGLRRDAAYLIRPDGYIGLADADSASLIAYVDRFGLVFRM